MYYVMEIEQRLFNRLGTTTMYLNLEILNFNYWCNVIFITFNSYNCIIYFKSVMVYVHVCMCERDIVGRGYQYVGHTMPATETG